jgi:hypothetical protein
MSMLDSSKREQALGQILNLKFYFNKMSQEYIKVQKTLSALRENIDIPLMEDFEDTTIRWLIGKLNSSGGATRDITHAFRGAASLKMDTGATTPTSNDYVEINKQIRPIKDNIISLSLKDQAATNSNLETLRFYAYLTNRETGKRYLAGIQRTQNNAPPIYQYESGLGTWTTFLNGANSLTTTDWQHLEIVVDLNKGEYLYAMVGSIKVSLAGIKMYSDTPGSENFDSATIRLQNLSAAERIDYIDDIVIDKVV